MYQVQLEQFEGPFDLLLKLCQEEKLEINKISLAKIADQYLEEISKATAVILPNELADFLVIAASLLFIKSKLLLPFLTDDGEEDGGNLEEKLKKYQQYLELAFGIQKQIRKHQFSFFREGLPLGWERNLQEQVVFIPQQTITADDLCRIFKELIVNLEKIQIKLPQEAIKRVVTLETKIKALKELLGQTNSLNFQDVVSKSSSRLEIVLVFLAVLELVKQRYIVIEQKELWGEIVITKQVNTDNSVIASPDVKSGRSNPDN